tara:strand:- start:166 stop:282 length:117 start_codon:yes stop_codon:yes gene_type:complete
MYIVGGWFFIGLKQVARTKWPDDMQVPEDRLGVPESAG